MTSGEQLVRALIEATPLPMEPIRYTHMKVIADAICDAWDRVVEAWPGPSREEPEKLVNFALVTQLKSALEKPSRFRTLVHDVERGVESPSFDGRKIENRPDLNFYLTSRRKFPLVGECKIIDVGTRRTFDKYRDQGLNRFIHGDYAWGAAEGLMVAYVRDASDARTALESITGTKPYSHGTSGNRFRSTHERTFSYPGRDPAVERPGSIDIVHIWLTGGPDEMHADRSAEQVDNGRPTGTNAAGESSLGEA